MNLKTLKKEINKLVDGYFNDLKEINEKLQEREKLITRLEFSRTTFAKAYMIKLGILITKKQWNKLCKGK